MSTPEGEVKDAIKALLALHKIYPSSKAGAFLEGAQGWVNMPVKGSFGVSGIPDFHGHYRGLFFAVEAKAPGKKPTGFQALQIAAIKQSGGFVCVVDGPESLKLFETWLKSI